MMSAIGTLMIESFATGYYKRLNSPEAKNQVNTDEEMTEEHTGHDMHVHTHARHGRAHRSASTSFSQQPSTSELIRHRIIAQVG